MCPYDVYVTSTSHAASYDTVIVGFGFLRELCLFFRLLGTEEKEGEEDGSLITTASATEVGLTQNPELDLS